MNNLDCSIYCPYCRRHTSLQVAKVETSDRYGQKVITGAVWKRSKIHSWWIGICNSCEYPVLVLNNGEEVFPKPFPTPTDKRIPELIRADLEEAKMCFSIDAYRACAVVARRAMETACLNKGAKKHKLVEQLHELRENGTITEDLKEWGDVVRWVGNDAAHPDKTAVTKEDAEDILNLAEQFLHVLYVAPAIAKEQKNKRNK